jgi:SulP family sulfate permease
MTKRGRAGDISGGLAAALAGLPTELVYGLFAVAPLGADFAHHGLRAALWACILGGAIGFLARTTGGLITGSRPATALILGTLAATLIQNTKIQALPDPVASVFVLLLLCTALAGVFQIIFGLIRFGRALKYVPYPVIAGLMCGVGLLMLISALRPALGVDYGTAWREVLAVSHPLSLLVTALTIFLCFIVPRWSKRIPAMIVALLLGSLFHHLIAWQMGAEVLGGTSRSLDGLIPEYSVWQFMISDSGNGLMAWLPGLVHYALAIAVLASLETLLCLAFIDSQRYERSNADHELIRQGSINFISGILGATPISGNLSRISVNLLGGAHTAFSAAVYAGTLILIIIFLGSWVNLLPSAVTAGIMVFNAIAMFDEGTRRFAMQVLTQRSALEPEQYRLVLANFIVVLLVAMVAVIGDMMLAIAVGLAAALFLFIRSSTKPVIRRVFTARYYRSLKVRTPENLALLEQQGDQVVVIDIDGALFFGTADRVASEIERVAENAYAIILDLKRVSDVDATAARTLLQVIRKIRSRSKILLFSGAKPRVERFMRALGLGMVVPDEHWHDDLDSALEWVEDVLLIKFGEESRHLGVHLSQTVLAKGLDSLQISQLESYLSIHLYDSADVIFRKDEAGDSLFVATGSIVDILLPLNNGKQKRVASFAPGVVFGEMALLEGKPRSADAVLQGASAVWELSRERLEKMEAHHPEIAHRILLNLSCSLAERLRMTTTALRLAVED